MDRVFLDANVLYSAGYKDTSALRELWELTEVELLFGRYFGQTVIGVLILRPRDYLASRPQEP